MEANIGTWINVLTNCNLHEIYKIPLQIQRGPNIFKLFTVVIYKRNKIESLSPARPF